MKTAEAMRWLAQNKGRPKPRRHPRLEPALKAQERDYVRQMMPMLNRLKELVSVHLIPAVKRASASYNAKKPEGSRRLDAADDDLRDAMKAIKIQYHREFTAEEIKRMAEKRGLSVAKMNKEILSKGIKKVLDIDLVSSEPYLSDTLGLFAEQNAALIESMTDGFMSKVEGFAYDAVTSGMNLEDIEDQIYQWIDPEKVAGGNVRARAELIARDQMGKLNGQLDEMRQTEIGVTRYVWRTVGDERVRDMHQKLDGQEFSWDEPPITSPYGDRNHPGEDYNCRCYAEPILSDLVEGVGDDDE